MLRSHLHQPPPAIQLSSVWTASLYPHYSGHIFIWRDMHELGSALITRTHHRIDMPIRRCVNEFLCTGRGWYAFSEYWEDGRRPLQHPSYDSNLQQSCIMTVLMGTHIRLSSFRMSVAVIFVFNQLCSPLFCSYFLSSHTGSEHITICCFALTITARYSVQSIYLIWPRAPASPSHPVSKTSGLVSCYHALPVHGACIPHRS